MSAGSVVRVSRAGRGPEWPLFHGGSGVTGRVGNRDFPLRGVDEVAVLVAVLVGEQNPEGIDAESSSQRRVEESQNAENDGDDASPGLALPQAHSNADASDAEDQKSGPNKINGDGEKGGDGLLLVNDEMKTATEEKNRDGKDEEQGTENDPENAEGLQVALEAGLGGGADGISKAASAIGAGDGTRLKLRSTAAAEHGRLQPLWMNIRQEQPRSSVVGKAGGNEVPVTPEKKCRRDTGASMRLLAPEVHGLCGR